jgi:hypothetical protein
MKYEEGKQIGFKDGHSSGWMEGLKEGKMQTEEKVHSVFNSTQSQSTNKPENFHNFKQLNGRRIIDIQLFDQYISSFVCCKVCSGSVRLEDEQNIEGLSSSLLWRCSNCF